MSRLRLPFVPADQRDTYAGSDREITFDPENTKLVIHDGTTAGGLKVASEQWVNESKIGTGKAIAMAIVFG